MEDGAINKKKVGNGKKVGCWHWDWDWDCSGFSRNRDGAGLLVESGPVEYNY